MPEIVTTIRLPDDLHRALRQRAFDEQRPMAELIREAIRGWLSPPAREATPVPLGEDPFWRVVGGVVGGPPDESTAHDHYVYGAPRKRDRRRKRTAT
jgi:plasmid stability protein